MITGSVSRGNGGKYFYYHYTCGCPERFRAELANDKLIKKINEEYRVKPGVLAAYYEILLDKFQTHHKQDQHELKRIDEAVAKNRSRIQNAQALLLEEIFHQKSITKSKLSSRMKTKS